MKMNRKGKGFFITAIVFTAIATLIFAYFLTLMIQLRNFKVEDVVDVIALPFAVIVILVYWMISGAVSGIIATVFSALGTRYTKWSILLLVLSILCIAAPFIYNLIAQIRSAIKDAGVQSAMLNVLFLIS